jgi:hypothetical protein
MMILPHKLPLQQYKEYGMRVNLIITFFYTLTVSEKLGTLSTQVTGHITLEKTEGAIKNG